MQLNIELAEGERLIAVAIRCPDGRVELREFDSAVRADPQELAEAPAPRHDSREFFLPCVVVLSDGQGDRAIEVRRGGVSETLLPSQCVVPADWPRNTELPAIVYVGPAGSLVLDRPCCGACQGKGTSPLAPPGYTGGSCPMCDGTGAAQTAASAAPEGEP